MALEGWLGSAEAAAKLGITVSALHRLVARGTLGATWLAGRRLFRVEIIDRLKDNAEYLARSRAGQIGNPKGGRRRSRR